MRHCRWIGTKKKRRRFLTSKFESTDDHMGDSEKILQRLILSKKGPH